jgi:hypothetical protein
LDWFVAGHENSVCERLRRQARHRLQLLDQLRAAGDILDRGLSRQDVADLLSISDAQAHRLLKAAQRRGATREPEPAEIILRAFAYGTDRAELIETLKAFPYTFGQDAPDSRQDRLPGTWDQVVSAHAQGLLSRDEFAQISAAIGR